MIARLIVWAALAATIILGTVVAWGHTADQPFADWYNGLKRPRNGGSCCDVSDCQHVPWRQTSDGYEVYLSDMSGNDPEWLQVPEEDILQQTDNPTGEAVTCHIGKIVYCFVREPES